MFVVDTKMEILKRRSHRHRWLWITWFNGVNSIYDLIGWKTKSDAQKQKLHVILRMVGYLDKQRLQIRMGWQISMSFQSFLWRAMTKMRYRREIFCHFLTFWRKMPDALRKKKRAKANKNHVHFKQWHFLDVGKKNRVSECNKKNMSSQAVCVVFLLPAVLNVGKLCDHSPKIFNLQKSYVVWLFLPWIATAEHSLLCQCWDRLITESNWIQLPRG